MCPSSKEVGCCMRKKLALWLVRLAHKIYCAEYYQVIWTEPNKNAVVLATEYGDGIMSTTGLDWEEFDDLGDVFDYIDGRDYLESKPSEPDIDFSDRLD